MRKILASLTLLLSAALAIAGNNSGWTNSGGALSTQAKSLGVNGVAGPAFFSDDFSSGDFSKSQNGFLWSGNANSSVISGFGPNGKNNCVRFNMDVGAGGVSDLRFLTGSTYQELWIRYYVYYPSGSESPTRGPKALNTSSNNKFLRVYSLPENQYPRYGASYYATTPSGDLTVGLQAGVFPGTGTVSEVGSGQAPLVNDSLRGTWAKVEFHVKAATSSGNNGVIQVWINDILYSSDFSLNSYESSSQGFDGGYLFGAVDGLWINSGTFVYMGDFAISSSGRIP